MALNVSQTDISALLSGAQTPSAESILSSLDANRQSFGARGRRRSRTAGEVAGDTALDLLGGAVDLGQFALGATNLVTLGALDRLNQAAGRPVDFRRANEIIASMQSDPLQASRAEQAEAFDESILSGIQRTVTDPSLLGSLTARTLPSLGPSVAAARLAGGRVLNAGLGAREAGRRATRASIGAGAVQSAGSTNIEAINRALEAGASQEEAQLAGLVAGPIAGAATGVLSKITGAGRLEAQLGNLGAGIPGFGARSLPRSIVGGAVREAAEESPQSAVEEIAANLLAPGVDTFEGAGEAAAVGGIAGALLGTGAGAAIGVQRKPSSVRRDSDLREQTNAQLKSLGDQASVDVSSDLAPAAEPVSPERVNTLLTERALNTQGGFGARRAAPVDTDAGVPVTQPLTAEEAALQRRQQEVLELFGDLVANDEKVPGYFIQERTEEGVREVFVPEADAIAAAQRVAQSTLEERVDFGESQRQPSETEAEFVARTTSSVEKVNLTRAKEPKIPKVDVLEVSDADYTKARMPEWEPEVEEIDITLPADFAEEQRLASIRKITEDPSRSRITAQDVNEALVRRRGQLFSEAVDPETGETFYRRVDAESGRVQVLTRQEANAFVRSTIEADLQSPDAPPVMSQLAGARGEQQTARLTPAGELPSQADRPAADIRELRRDFAKAQLFEQTFTPTGKEVFLRWVPATQSHEVVSSREVEKAVTDFLVEQDKSPSDKWKDFLAKEFGLPRKSLTGKAFTDLANQADTQEILPSSPQGLALLRSVARTYADEASGSKFTEWLSGFSTRKAVSATDAAKFNPLVRFDLMLREAQDTYSLRNNWESIKAEPDFRSLDDTAKRSVQETFEKLHARMETTGSLFREQLNLPLDGAEQPATLTAAGDATPEVAQKVQTAIEGRTPAEWADWLAVNGLDKQKRDLAKRIAVRLRQLESIGIKFTGQVVHIGDMVPAKLLNARGLASLGVGTAEGVTMDIYVNGADVSGKVGVDYETLLHELVHGATMVTLATKADLLPAQVVKARQELRDTMSEVLAEIQGKDPDSRTKIEQEILNVTTDVDEFVAYATTDRDFQAYLRTQGEQGKKSWWQRLIESLRKMMGLGAVSPDTLSRVLDATNSIIDHEYSLDAAPAESSDKARLIPSRKSIEDRAAVARAAPDAPISHARIEQLAASANAERQGTGRLPVVVYDTPGHYEQHTGNVTPSNAKGVYDGERVVVIASNIKSEADFASTVLHERGHEGLRALFGDRLSAVTSRVWANPALRARAKAYMTSNPGESRAIAAEEVLVDMLASGERLNKSLLSKLRSVVNDVAAKLVGVGDINISDRDIDTLLADTAAYLRDHNVGVTGTKLTNDQANKALDDAILDPDALSTIARFSRASALMREAQDVSRPERSESMGPATQAAMDGAADAMRTIKSGLTGEAGLFKGALAFMPLNQVVSYFAKQFEPVVARGPDGELRLDADGNPEFFTPGNPLKLLGTLVRRRDAAFNKVLLSEGRYGNFDMSLKGFVDEWKKFKRDKKQAALVDSIQQFGTLYRVFPDRAWEDQPSVNYDEMGFTAEERRAEHQRLSQEWAQLSDKGREIYQKSQAAYGTLWHQRFETLTKEIERVTGLKRGSDAFKQAYGNNIEAALNKLRAGPYAPLQRYGDYVVTVRDQNGEVAWFSAHDTKDEQASVASHLRGQFDPESYAVDKSTMKDATAGLTGLGFGDVDRIRSEIVDKLRADMRARDGATDEEVELQASTLKAISDGLVEAALQSRSQSSILKHAIQRRGIAGFSLDSFRAFNDYVTKAAKNISSIEYDGQVDRAMLDMEKRIREVQSSAAPNSITDTNKMQTVVDAVRRQQEGSRNLERNKITDWASAYSFAHFMSSPSQLFVNATQTAMVAFPRLAAKYGGNSARKAVTNGLKDFFRSGRDMLGERSVLDPETKGALQELYDRGILDFTQAHDLAGLARGEFGTLSERWRKMAEVASVFMHHSEVFNRQVTAYAAAKLEAERIRAAGGTVTAEALADVAEQAVIDTHFDYSGDNKPTVLQGPWRRVIFQFQQYRLNMLAMIAKDIRDGFIAKDATPEEKREARSALTWMLGTQLALTGAVGTVLSPVVFAIADAFRDDDELLDSETAFARSVPPILAHGLLHGVLDLSRIEGSGLLPYFGERRFSPVTDDGKEAFLYYAQRYLGPTFSLAGEWATFFNKAAAGNVGAADWEKIAPKIVSGMAQAFNERAGATTASKATYFEPNLFDTTMTAAGLKSGSRREAEELRGAAYEAQQRATIMRSRYLTRLSLGVIEGDRDAVVDAVRSISDWNQANPSLAIDSKAIRGAVDRKLISDAFGRTLGIPVTRLPDIDILKAIGLDAGSPRG